MALSVLIMNVSYADTPVKQEKEFLKHCNKAGIAAKGNTLILNAKHNPKQADWVYVLHNTTKQPVYINHPADHPGTASAGWGSRIDAKQWSALMLNRPAFALTCQNSILNNKHSVVACKKVLQVYRFKPHHLAKNKQNSFWIGENQSLDKLLNTLHTRGINWK